MRATVPRRRRTGLHRRPPTPAEVAVPSCIDLRAEPDPVEAAHRWMNDNYHRPIDLLGDQLTDLALLRITDNLSYFYLRAHHVLFDGYGAYNFIRHIAAAYSGSVGGHHRRQLLRMP
nr:condensation domain-containing protein [Mycobacterium paragordonae]